MRFANLLGCEGVMAGADCGLGGRIHPKIALAKLRSLSQGAGLARQQLGGRSPWEHAFAESMIGEGETPALVTSAGIRPFVRGIVERFRAQTPVLSQAEIHPRTRLKTVGSI